MPATARRWRATRRSCVVGLVISDSSRSLFREGGNIPALTQVPRFLAVAPGADLGSGNEAIVAAHQYSVTGVSIASE